MSELYNLERFKKAQKYDYEIALEEIRNGRKESHWMWYIFPQMKCLGKSSVAMYYAIQDMEEAKEYLEDNILRQRLEEISEALLELETDSAEEIFGWVDSLKLRSSMTLFAKALEEASVFQEVLEKFFEGKEDERTLEILEEE